MIFLTFSGSVLHWYLQFNVKLTFTPPLFIPCLKEYDVHVTVHCDKFLIIKPTRCTNFSNLFWSETLHVSDSSSIHHQEFFTVHTATLYVIPVFWQLASGIRIRITITSQVINHSVNVELVPSWSCLQAVCQTVWHIPLLCVRWKTPDDGQRNCPKHVEFHSKINLRS